MRLIGLLLIFSTACLSAPAQTNAPEVRKLSLQDCLQTALSRNLDLQISRYTVPEAEVNLAAAFAGYDPVFSSSVRHNYSESAGSFSSITGTNTPSTVSRYTQIGSSVGGLLPWGLNYTLSGNLEENWGTTRGPFDSSFGNTSIGLVQPLLKNFWIDSTRLNIQVARNRLRYSTLGLKESIMTTATTVEQAYYNLIYARENVQVQEQALELAESLVAQNRIEVQVGAMAPLDLQQAESQAATSQAALIAARSQLAVQENTLKQLLTDNFAAWQPVNVEPTLTLAAPEHTFDLQKSWSEGLTERPDFLQAKLDVEKQGITLKYDFNQLFPEVDLIGGYGRGAGGGREFSDALSQIENGTQPSHYFGGQITIPLANTGARATYRADRLVRQTLVLQLKKLEQSIMVAIDNDIKQAESSYEQVAATRAARQYAEAALVAEQKKLQQGKSTTYTVLQMQRDLTAARGAEIQAIVTYNNNLSQLSLDEGTTLQRLGIDFQTAAQPVTRPIYESLPN